MRYYLDCEFLERPCTIDLLSLALVREDGEYLYVINQDCDLTQANDFVREHVIPNLDHPGTGPNGETYPIPPHVPRMSRFEIAYEVLKFVGGDSKPQFKGYYADYDWVVFCWLFGRMVDLPKHFPFYCHDLKQTADEVRGFKGPDLIARLKDEVKAGKHGHAPPHNALVDACFARKLDELLLAYASGQLR